MYADIYNSITSHHYSSLRLAQLNLYVVHFLMFLYFLQIILIFTDILISPPYHT